MSSQENLQTTNNLTPPELLKDNTPMPAKGERLKKYILFSFLTFDAFAFSVLSYRYLASREQVNVPATETSVYSPKSTSAPIPQGLETESQNFLLLGYGGAGHSGGNLSDVVMVVNVNPIKKKATFISIPRDLWVPIPIRSDMNQNFKINAAYAIGGDDKKYPLKEPKYKGDLGAPNMAKVVVGEVAGLKIRNYVGIDFENFKRLIDALGEVNVDVPVAFDDYQYPIKGRENDTCGFSADKIAEIHVKFTGDQRNYQFECRYEPLHFDKGVQKINGESALKFVRSRHSAQDGGDFARSRRQKAVLLGMKDKLLSMYAIKNADEIYNELKGLVRTDLDLVGAKTLLKVFGEPKDYSTKFIGLSSDNVLVNTKSFDGQFILIPKDGENVWTGVQAFIYQEINNW